MGLTRRALIAGAGVAGLAFTLRRSGSDLEKATLASPVAQQVVPVHSDLIYQSYGVCTHPNFNTTVYADTGAWIDRLATLDVRYFRGLYAEGLESVAQTVSEARSLGLGWVATVTPPDWTQSTTALNSRLAHIRDNAADVIIAIEGVNEPNNIRGGGSPPADWAEQTLDVQKAIYEFVKTEMPSTQVIGPSLHATVPTAYADHLRLGSLGVQNYFDYAGLHRYFGGRYPDYLVDERLGWINEAYGDVPTWVTETGYTNAMATPDGHLPVPEEVSAAYAPITVLEFFTRGCQSIRYELLDDPDPDNADIESSFGLWRTPSLDSATWTEKPEADVMRTFLASLKDPGRPFTPEPVRLKVGAPANVRWLLTGTRTGVLNLLLWQAAQIFDPESQQSVTVPTATAEIAAIGRSQTVTVPAGEVVVASLRT
ncbi:MAG: hypothetical protein ABI720_00325 [Actinomycetes bacterium]